MITVKEGIERSKWRDIIKRFFFKDPKVHSPRTPGTPLSTSPADISKAIPSTGPSVVGTIKQSDIDKLMASNKGWEKLKNTEIPKPSPETQKAIDKQLNLFGEPEPVNPTPQPEIPPLNLKYSAPPTPSLRSVAAADSTTTPKKPARRRQPPQRKEPPKFDRNNIKPFVIEPPKIYDWYGTKWIDRKANPFYVNHSYFYRKMFGDLFSDQGVYRGPDLTKYGWPYKVGQYYPKLSNNEYAFGPKAEKLMNQYHNSLYRYLVATNPGVRESTIKSSELKNIINELIDECGGGGYVHTTDIKKDPKHITDPGSGKPERWRIKFASSSDLKKHGDTEMSPVDEDETISMQEVKDIIKEIISEMWAGWEENKNMDESIVPQSKPTPQSAEELWKIVDGMKVGQSISFYNPNNSDPNLTSPWIYIKKVVKNGPFGKEITYNIDAEVRESEKIKKSILVGMEDFSIEDEVTEDEVGVALEAVVKNIKILSMYYIETEEKLNVSQI